MIAWNNDVRTLADFLLLCRKKSEWLQLMIGCVRPGTRSNGREFFIFFFFFELMPRAILLNFTFCGLRFAKRQLNFYWILFIVYFRIIERFLICNVEFFDNLYGTFLPLANKEVKSFFWHFFWRKIDWKKCFLRHLCKKLFFGLYDSLINNNVTLWFGSQI